MAKDKKIGHAITKKAPIAAMVIWVVVALGLQSISSILCVASGLFASNGDLAQNMGIVIGSIVFLLIMTVWYRPDFKGVVKSGLSMKKTLLYTLPVIVYSVAMLIYQLIRYNFYWDGSLSNAVQAMAAGFGEEAMFRAALIPIAMGFFKSEKRVWYVPVITGVIFGCSHLGNVAAGASVVNGIVQAVVTALVGVYYGALFVATGSTIPGIVMHSIYDFICFAGDPSLTGGIMTDTIPASEIVFNLIPSLALMAAGIMILKKLGAPEVLKIWKNKWNRE